MKTYRAGELGETLVTGDDGGGLLTDLILDVRLRFGGNAGGIELSMSVGIVELLRLHK